MKVLLTGPNGQLGGDLRRAHAAAGAPPRGIGARPRAPRDDRRGAPRAVRSPGARVEPRGVVERELGRGQREREREATQRLPGLVSPGATTIRTNASPPTIDTSIASVRGVIAVTSLR